LNYSSTATGKGARASTGVILLADRRSAMQ
jgi:hypothetical protein